MFGCLAAGRLVQAAPQQVDVNRFVFELQDAARINHLVVFLTGAIPFDEGYGASVHLLWPGADWQLLGMLSNDKPSAIFRLRDLANARPAPTASDAAITAMVGLSVEPLTIIQQQLENSLPPTMPALSGQFTGMTSIGAGAGGSASTPNALIVANSKSSNDVNDTKSIPVERVMAIGKRLLSFMNSYVTSYAKPLPGNQPGMVQLPNQTMMMGDANAPASNAEGGLYINVKVFDDWWRTTERRLRTDPGFLTREE